LLSDVFLSTSQSPKQGKRGPLSHEAHLLQPAQRQSHLLSLVMYDHERVRDRQFRQEG